MDDDKLVVGKVPTDWCTLSFDSSLDRRPTASDCHADNGLVNVSSDVRYRRERPGEEQQVREVVEDAFRRPVVVTLLDRLRESPDWIDGLSFVAESDDRICAHPISTADSVLKPQASSASVGHLYGYPSRVSR